MGARHTYEMGIVGNCAFMAHIDRHARVVWLCMPRFDSGSIFAHLHDSDRGGVFAVQVEGAEAGGRQEYRRNTNLLETTLEGSGGSVRVIDCAPRFVRSERAFRPLMLIRKVEPLGGTPRVRVLCRPRGDYGATEPEVHRQSDHLRYQIGDEVVRLYSDIPISYVAGEREFVLSEPRYLILSWGAPLEAALEDTAEEYLRRTERYWREWVSRCAIGRFYQQHVIRSALVLKLHQFEDTGAIIASGTTSLPEHPGSGRNWNYRYCWLRDAYFILTALNRIGQFGAMQRFANFIEDIAATSRDRYPAVVRIDGALELPETTVPLKGYDGSGLVRVGNAAYAQVQNDIYGQMIYALLMLYIDERFPREPRVRARKLIGGLLDIIARRLDEPDASLWEFRGFTRRHVFTLLCHWVGGKAAARIARELGDRDMLRAATRLVVRAARLLESCYDPTVGAYMQEPGSAEVDASALQLITLHYLDPPSERAARHLEALEARLCAGGGLLHRYTHKDDFGHPRSAFLVCSFWYVEALAAMGRIEAALKELELLLGYANSLGLFSEDVDPESGSQWGNFPQAYSHVGLMNAVLRITSRIDYPDFY